MKNKKKVATQISNFFALFNATFTVNEVFQNVAEKYDVMNDAMSLGIHRLWKDCFINRLGPADNTQLLDVAGGTGDIAFRFLNYVKQYNIKNCHVTVTDINPSMLEVGKSRSRALQHNPETISWQEGNSTVLLLTAETIQILL